jgi:hypothetical protein
LPRWRVAPWHSVDGVELASSGGVDLQVHENGQRAEACDDERYQSYVEPVPF